MSKMTNRFQLPTPEEVRAIELAARRARTEELHRLMGLAARGTKAFFSRVLSRVHAKLRHHSGGGVAGHGA